MSQITSYSNGIAPGAFIEKIDGDTGYVSGAIVTLTSPTSLSGTPKFIGNDLTAMEWTVEDSHSNVILGAGTTLPSSGTLNVAIGHLPFAASGLATTASNNVSAGYQGLSSITTGSSNVNAGYQGLINLMTGSNNINISTYQGGISYSNAESNNILLNASTTTVTSENNTLRIGDGTGTSTQQLQAAYISGIDGVALTTANVVTEASNQLGTAVITGGTGITIDGTSTPNKIIINASGGGGATITTDDSNVESSPFILNAFTGISTGTSNCGVTVNFTGDSSHTINLNVTDANNNTLVGLKAGQNNTISGGANSGFGAYTLQGLTSGGGNVGFGSSMTSLTTGNNNFAGGLYALVNLVSGSNCIGVGANSGTNWNSSESNNISINAATTTVTGENNVLRIGDGTGTGQQQLQAAYISGINGTTGTGTAVVVTAGNQLTAGGISTNSSQPAFFAYNSTGAGGVTGDGTVYTVIFDTIVTNQSSSFDGVSTFTAPVTGLYNFNAAINFTGTTLSDTTGVLSIVVNGASYVGVNMNPGAITNAFAGAGFNASLIAIPMAVSQTATVTLAISGSTKTVAIFGLSTAPFYTYFSGHLVC